MASFGRELVRLGATVVDLGDCIGADDQAHEIAVALGLRTVGHIPTMDRRRAFKTYDEERPPYPYLVRNHHIVDESEALIGLPESMQEHLRSGTWSTVRYARRVGRPIIIIAPNGEIYDDPNLLTPRV